MQIWLWDWAMVRELRNSEVHERRSLDSFGQTTGTNMGTKMLLMRAQKELGSDNFKEYLNYHRGA